MKEIWKDIEGFEGYYKISNFGNVKSYDRAVIKTNNSVIGYLGKLLSPYNDGRGYLKVDLHKNGKRISVRVHRLVAKAFIPNPNNLPTVNHKDENKLNNNASNLEWMSIADNNNYGSRHNKTSLSHRKRARTIYQFTKGGFLINSYPSPAEASDWTGIKRGNILGCACGCTSNGIHIRKTAGGFIWSYNKDLFNNDRTRK